MNDVSGSGEAWVDVGLAIVSGAFEVEVMDSDSRSRVRDCSSLEGVFFLLEPLRLALGEGGLQTRQT